MLQFADPPCLQICRSQEVVHSNFFLDLELYILQLFWKYMCLTGDYICNFLEIVWWLIQAKKNLQKNY